MKTTFSEMVAGQSYRRVPASWLPLRFSLAVLAACAWLPTATLGSDYFVANTGADANPGTLAAPFQTISRAAALMKPGDRCLIRAGVYRETVTPVANDLYFGPYHGERVEISGCDVVTGPWETATGPIQKASVAPKVLQVFVQGRRMNLARYPAETPQPEMLSYAHWAKTTTSTRSLGVGQVVFPDMPSQPANYWVGGYYSGHNGRDPFTAACGRITASQGNTITIDHLSFWWRQKTNVVASAVGEGSGYIINQIHALTAPSQWYWGAGQLYLDPPDGVALAHSPVEARTRLWGFDLSNRTSILVEGLAFHAASLLLDNSIRCEIRDCTVLYPAPWSDYDYPAGLDYGGKIDGSCGVFVSGSHNRIVGCQIAHSWGGGVRLDGSDNTLAGCTVEDIDWAGRRMSPVQLLGLRNHVIGNVISRSGQSGIDGGNAGCGLEQVGYETDISSNLVMDAGLLTADTGLYYVNTQGSPKDIHAVIAYNTFLRIHGSRNCYPIYVDNGTCGVIIHHNVVVGGPASNIGIFLHKQKGQSDIAVDNNTVLQPGRHSIACGAPWGVPQKNILFRNNLCDKSMIGATESSHNITNAVPREFVNAKAYDFHLLSSV